MDAGWIVGIGIYLLIGAVILAPFLFYFLSVVSRKHYRCPQCGERIRAHVLRFGKVYVCRSCALLYTGVVVGGLACGLWHEPLQQLGTWPVLPPVGLLLVMSFPLCYQYWPRPVRDVLRLAAGVTLAWCGFLLVSGRLAWGLHLVGLLAAVAVGFATLRRRARGHACAGCPELQQRGICSGYTRQAELIRQYEQAATQRILAAGVTPFLPADNPDVFPKCPRRAVVSRSAQTGQPVGESTSCGRGDRSGGLVVQR